MKISCMCTFKKHFVTKIIFYFWNQHEKCDILIVSRMKRPSTNRPKKSVEKMDTMYYRIIYAQLTYILSLNIL